MRISKISVTKLFGIFNHPVSLNMEDKITIIHGMNGIGKTTLLRLINGFFNSQYSEILSIPFEEFRLDFDNGSHLQITKVIGKVSKKKKEMKLIFHANSLDIEPPKITLNLSWNSNSSVRSSDRTNLPVLIQQLERLQKKKSGKSEDFQDLLDSWLDKGSENLKQEPEWLSELKSSIDVRFIESQRLLHLSDISQRRLSWENPSMILSVDKYSQEMAKNIQIKLAEYAAFSQSLDRTFLTRVVNKKAPSNLTEEALRNKSNEIEEQRSRLIKTGLLDKDENPDFQVPQNIDEPIKYIFYFYLEDVEEKNTFFNEISTRIELFQRIITERFRYKTIRIDKDKGFIFTTPDGKPLSPTDLSSGEQHELVMLYELLFKVKPNSLILIDEPELSLHLAWQVQFLKDLQAIIKLADFDVLIATHAPGIIDDRWDLTVELKGPVA